MLPSAHTACSQTLKWGDDSSLISTGTAPIMRKERWKEAEIKRKIFRKRGFCDEEKERENKRHKMAASWVSVYSETPPKWTASEQSFVLCIGVPLNPCKYGNFFWIPCFSLSVPTTTKLCNGLFSDNITLATLLTPVNTQNMSDNSM